MDRRFANGTPGTTNGTTPGRKRCRPPSPPTRHSTPPATPPPNRPARKFEAAIKEQIQQTTVLFQAGRERLDAKIEALKERLDRGEGGHAGTVEYRTERRLDLAQVIAVVSVIVAIAAVMILAFKHTP